MANEDDIDELLALETAVFPSDQLSKRSFRHCIKNPSRTPLLVAKENGAFLGYILLFFRKNSSYCRIYSVAVSPSEQGKGIGHALLQQAITRAQKNGSSILSLEVREKDTHVVEFYRKHGFNSIRKLTTYYEDGADALRMELNLTTRQKRIKA